MTRAATIPAGGRKKRALRIVHRYMLVAGGIGLIPAPFFDQVAVGGLLAKMVYDLCALYGVKVAEHKSKTIISALLGGAHAEWISRYLLNYSDRYLPGLSSIGRTITRPIASAATVYAIGVLFVHHFDKGAWPPGEAIPANDRASLPSSVLQDGE